MTVPNTTNLLTCSRSPPVSSGTDRAGCLVYPQVLFSRSSGKSPPGPCYPLSTGKNFSWDLLGGLAVCSEQTELQKAGLALSFVSSAWGQQARPMHWQCKPTAQSAHEGIIVLLSPHTHTLTHKATHQGISCHTWLLQKSTKRSRPSNSALWGSRPHSGASGHPRPASWQRLSSTSAHLSPTATLTLSPTATPTCVHEARPLLSLVPINKSLSLPAPWHPSEVQSGNLQPRWGVREDFHHQQGQIGWYQHGQTLRLKY